jgi:hypothetical protein
MSYRVKPAVLSATAVLTCMANGAARAAEDVTFVPHRAVYEISLLRSVSGSGVSDMSGRMVYELGGSACEGYTQNMRFVTRMTNQEGGQTLNDLRTSSFEEGNGSRLRFSSSQYADEKLAEATQGDAVHGKDGKSAAVDLVKPKKVHMKLPADVDFPMQHMRELIQTARAGKSILAAKLYEGGEKGDKYYLTTSVIGAKAAPGAAKATASLKEAAQLDGLASWPVSISYFDAGKDKSDTTPAYELSFRYYENGVTSDLKIDYGEFAIKGELKELSLHEVPKCPSGVH